MIADIGMPGRAGTGRGARRRQKMLEAAVDVVATRGLRGLTHRAVDARAGFPEGTTSAYLRTRAALLTALAEHVAASASADVDQLAKNLIGREGDHDFAVAQTMSLISSWLEDRSMLVTRLELSIEATRQPALAEIFRPWREQLLDIVEERLCRVGVPDPRLQARVVVASLEGALMAALGAPAEGGQTLASEGIGLLLRQMLANSETTRW